MSWPIHHLCSFGAGRVVRGTPAGSTEPGVRFRHFCAFRRYLLFARAQMGFVVGAT